MEHISKFLPIEQDCSLCEKTYFSREIREICPECMALRLKLSKYHKYLKPQYADLLQAIDKIQK